jgi:hypothetical protein
MTYPPGAADLRPSPPAVGVGGASRITSEVIDALQAACDRRGHVNDHLSLSLSRRGRRFHP